jgi:hypothetical protein
MIKNFKLFETTHKDVDPLGEEKWEEDSSYNILYVSSMETTDHYFYLDCVEGYIDESYYTPEGKLLYVDFSYIINGDRKKACSHSPYVVDRIEDFDLGKMKSLYYNLEGDTRKKYYDKSGHCTFIRKEIMTKEEFLKISHDIFDENANNLIQILKKKIIETENRIEKLKKREIGFNTNIE